MELKRTDKFRKDAVCIALTSALTRKQVADDLGVKMSTLNKMDHSAPRYGHGVERGFRPRPRFQKMFWHLARLKALLSITHQITQSVSTSWAIRLRHSVPLIAEVPPR
jgi:hypothetical protein